MVLPDAVTITCSSNECTYVTVMASHVSHVLQICSRHSNVDKLSNLNGEQRCIHVTDDNFQISDQKHEVQPCSSGSKPGDSTASAAAMLKATPALPTSPLELVGPRLVTTAGALSALLPGEW